MALNHWLGAKVHVTPCAGQARFLSMLGKVGGVSEI